MVVYENLVTKKHHGELKDILMLPVTADADIFVVNNRGESVSDLALKYGHSLAWKETLVECEYDVLNVLNHVHDQHEVPLKEAQRPSLTFAEYLEVRKSRLLNLEVGEDESPREVYERYYKMAVAKDLRIEGVDSSDSETGEDEAVFEDEAGSNSDAESFETALELTIGNT